MVVSPRCLERGPSSTPSHHPCEGRPPAFQASRAKRATHSAVASAACLEGRPGPVTPSTICGSQKSPGECRGFSSRCGVNLLQRPEPVVHIPVDLVLGKAVALLQLAFELLAPALDHVEIVVGELAPFFLGGALELLPVTFDPVPIHLHLLLR